MVSRNVQDSLNYQDSILNPRRGGASADMEWLWKTFDRLKTGRHELEFSADWYSFAIGQLLDNRQALMETWISRMGTKGNRTDLDPSIYWLLFQTTCTPEYDPFKDTLRLGMLANSGTLQRHEPKSEHVNNPPIVIDEAQNELDPFWTEEASLTDVIRASGISDYVLSVSGTSLRLKDCQTVICKYSGFITQTQTLEDQKASIFRALRTLKTVFRESQLTETIVQQILQHCNTESSEKRFSAFLRGKMFANILGHFYFTETLQNARQAKEQSTEDILEKWKDFLIPILGRHHQEQVLHETTPLDPSNFQQPGSSMSKENIFKSMFKEYHSWCIGDPDIFQDGSYLSDNSRALLGLLSAELMSLSMSQLQETPLSQISSNDTFSALLSAHIKRLLRRIGYFWSLGPRSSQKEFWRIACPKTDVFQGTEDVHGGEEFYQRAINLLGKFIHSNPLQNDELKNAAEKVERQFRQAFEEEQSTNDESKAKTVCGITKYSTLFHGRIRWSVIYIEHVFASYLKTLDLGPAKGTSRYITSSSDTGGSIQEDKPMLDRVASPFLIEGKAKEAASYIKMSLKHRIEELKKKGHYILLRDLYSTAARAVLMHKATIFPADRSARMISEGFAVLDSDGSTFATRQKLSEPIVVDAVIDFLRDRESAQMEGLRDEDDTLENVLQNVLFGNQDDASSFGKSTEFYFAWSLGGLFFQGPDAIHLSPLRLGEFRPKISQARFISSNGNATNLELGNIEAYKLAEPSPYLRSDITLGSKIAFADWLSRVRNEKFFPTFHFPSTFAGPDIVFCLEGQDENREMKRILCAFQIKTGSGCSKDEAFKLIRTVEPRLWFYSARNLQRELAEELNYWKDARILTALVITSGESEKFFASESDFRIGLQKLQAHLNAWYPYRDLSGQMRAVNELKNKETFSEDHIKLMSEVEEIAKENKIPIQDTTKPRHQLVVDLVTTAQTHTNALVRAAESIRKDRLRSNPTTVDSDNSLRASTSDVDYRSAKGYYFVILDNPMLEPVLGPVFTHLCTQMKMVEEKKMEQAKAEEEAPQTGELRCGIFGCPRKSQVYKRTRSVP